VADAQLHGRVVAGAERDVGAAIGFDTAWSAYKGQVLALEAIALGLHVHVSVELQRAELAVDFDVISGKVDAILMRRSSRLRSRSASHEANAAKECV
jgi:hypothetical protein